MNKKGGFDIQKEKNAEKEEDYIPKSELKERGWTDSMIKKLNLKPDTSKRNPMYPTAAPPMKLYSREKIEQIEKTPEFEELYEKSLKRKKSAQKAVETKKEKLLEFAENVKIKVKYIEEPQLTDLAIQSFNNWHFLHDDVPPASRNSDEVFLDRIRNNFIRHELTNYDRIIAHIRGQIGKHEAYQLIKERVMERIDEEWNRKKTEQEKNKEE